MGPNTVRRARSGPLPAWADLSCSPAELYRVLAALLAGRDQDLAAELADGSALLEVLTMLVERHRLGCYLAGRLEDSPVRPLLPEGLWQSIQGRREQQQRRTARILEELHWLLPRFERAGIPVMLLKGPELEARFHGGLHQRGYGDLDLLVRERDRRAALQLLEDLGYLLRSRVVLSRSLMASVHHGFDFERQGVRLDLHWCLSRQPGYRIDEAAFWGRSVGWRHGDRTIHVPHAQDELHLLLISAFADLQRGALRLQSLLDVQALLVALAPLDVASFLALRRRERTAEVCGTMLGIAHVLLGSQASSAIGLVDGRGHPSRDQVLSLLSPVPGQWRVKLWCARRLPVNLGHYALWWLASLPLRTAASHQALRPASAGGHG
jgi:hypothetical protein